MFKAAILLNQNEKSLASRIVNEEVKESLQII